MLKPSVHIPDRVLQGIGVAGVAAFVVGLIRAIKDEMAGSPAQERDVPLATTHPAVPTDLFSSMYKRENRPGLAAHRGNRWLFCYGDKVCHSALSLLLHISQGAQLPRSTSESRRALFALFLQAALADTRLQMASCQIGAKEVDAMLACVALTILDTPLEQLQLYRSLLSLDEDERKSTVAREAVRLLGAPANLEKHYAAAYVLLRTMTMVLVMEASFGGPSGG